MAGNARHEFLCCCWTLLGGTCGFDGYGPHRPWELNKVATCQFSTQTLRLQSPDLHPLLCFGFWLTQICTIDLKPALAVESYAIKLRSVIAWSSFVLASVMAGTRAPALPREFRAPASSPVKVTGLELQLNCYCLFRARSMTDKGWLQIRG